MSLLTPGAATIFIRPPRASAAARLARRASSGLSTASDDLVMAETLEQRRLLTGATLGDLAIELGNFAPLSFYAPGETVTVPYVVRNNDAIPFTGRAVVSLGFLSTGVAQTISQPLSGLAPDATATGSVSFVIPSGFAQGNYIPRLTLTLRNLADTFGGPDNSTIDNQITVNSNPVTVAWRFGTFGDRSGVVMRDTDADGTVYTMSMTGGGYGEIAGSSNSLVLHGVRGAAGPIPQSVSITPLAGQPGTVPGIDFYYFLSTASQSAQLPDTLIGALVAPMVNFRIGFSLGSDAAAATNASTTVTVRDIDYLVSRRGNASSVSVIYGPVGSFTAAAVRTNLVVGGSAGAVRFSSLGMNGILVYVRLGGSVASLTIGNPATPDTVAVVSAQVEVDGPVGAVNIGSALGYYTTDTTFTFAGNTGALSFGDLNTVTVTAARLSSSMTARHIQYSSISLGDPGSTSTVATPFTAADIAQSDITLHGPVSTFTARNWFNYAGPYANTLRARSINTLTLGGPVPTGGPVTGSFNATAYIGGIGSRPTQLGTATIYGTLSGSFFVAGSVGAFTAATVDSGAFRDTLTRGVPNIGEWAPALTATGSVLSFTSGNVKSGAVWVNTLRTATLTVTSNNRNFELIAGFRADRAAIAAGAGRNSILYGTAGVTPPEVRSGVIGTLNLTLGTQPGGGPVTGFSGRFAAGLDVYSSYVRTTRSGSTGVLNFAAASYSLVYGTPASQGRIGLINVGGVLAGNSLQLAARDYQGTRFNFGSLATGAGGVQLPARGDTIYSAPITSLSVADHIPANTFFRVGELD